MRSPWRGWTLTIRLLLTAGAVASGFFSTGDPEPIGNLFPYAMILIGALIGSFLVVTVQAANPMSAPRWDPPSWSGTVLDFKQPLVTLHLFSILTSAAAAGAALQTLVSGDFSRGGGAAFLLAVALGMRLGLGLCALAFRARVGRE